MPIFDVFRLLSAVIVWLVHYQYFFGERVLADIWGTSALSWFFALSGFVLAYNYNQLSMDGVKKFYVSRFIRIYPIYLVALLVGSFISVAGYQYYGRDFFELINRPDIVTENLPYLVYDELWKESLWKHFVFLQLISNTDFIKFLLNPPLWSIANEVFFYLLFPFLIPIARRLDKGWKILAALLGAYFCQWYLIGVFSEGIEPQNWFTVNEDIYTNPWLRVWEFIIGIIIFKAYEHTPKTWPKPLNYGLLIFAVGFYCAAMLAAPDIPYTFLLYFYSLPCIALLIFSMAHTPWQPTGDRRKFVEHLGGTSYVIYCFHWPLMELTNMLGYTRETSHWHLFSLLVTTLIVSFYVHVYFEKRMHRALKARVFNRQ